jgi:signal transduction histidine kinase
VAHKLTNQKLNVGSLKSDGIGKRLVVVILLFSSVITLILTSFQLYLDFRRDVDTIEMRLEEVRQSHLQSLAASLWNLDVGLLKLQMEGLERLPDMVGVELKEISSDNNDPLAMSIGNTFIEKGTIHRGYGLFYAEGEQEPRHIGQLTVYASLDGVYARLLDKALVILVSQGVKTFLVSLFILLVIHRIITRHLVTISRHLSTLNFNSQNRLLQLERNTNQNDELSLVVESVNQMSISLEQAYNELQQNSALLELRVKERTAELELANKELDSFAYSVSHDLKAPLRAIDGFSEILLSECSDKLNKDEKSYLHYLRDGSKEMAGLIEGLLMLSRSSRGVMSFGQVDLSVIVQKIISGYCEGEPNRNVVCNITPDLLVNGDLRLIKIMLENLIGNAWKYSKDMVDARIEFGVKTDDGKTIYFIKDNGAGFDMKYAKNLFQPFKRLHRAGEFEGTGIGLATVQRIVARHGGEIWAKAEVNKGATFCFTLTNHTSIPQ